MGNQGPQAGSFWSQERCSRGIRTGTCWPYRAGGQRLCPTTGLNAPLATYLTTSRRESPTDLLCLHSPAFQGTDLRVGQRHLSDPTTHGEDTPVFGQTNQDHPHSKSPTTAGEVGLLLSSRQRLKTERVGFEPTEGCPSNDFESFAFDHSATSPRAHSPEAL